MTIEELRAKKSGLAQRRDMLKAIVDRNSSMALRLELAGVEEDIRAINAQIRDATATAPKNGTVTRKVHCYSGAEMVNSRITLEEFPIVRPKKKTAPPGSLLAIAEGYRDTADGTRLRINELKEIPAKTYADKIVKAERLRHLEAIRREARDLAVICENYYKRGGTRNERYLI